MLPYFLLALAIAATIVGQAFASETLGEVYRIQSSGCRSGSGRQGTGFSLAGRDGIFSSLHTVNGCGVKQALSTSAPKSARRKLEICRAAIEFDIAVLDSDCSRHYQYSFSLPPLTDERLYVIGYPLRAGQFRRPVFLFKHEKAATTRMDTLGLDADIFTKERGVGLAPHTPVIVIGASIAPGDSGAPLVTANNLVVGIVGGGRREVETQALVGITWAVALGPELASGLEDEKDVKRRLEEIAQKPINQFFSNEAFKKFIHSVEFVEVRKEPDSSGQAAKFWVMATEATQKQYHECVREKGCDSGPGYDITTADRPVLLDRMKDGVKFCKWLSPDATLLDESVWLAAASRPQIRATARNEPPFKECSVNLKDFPGCASSQEPREVGVTEPNELGIYDLFGNVWEWLQTADGTLKVAGGAFNTPYKEIGEPDGIAPRAVRGRPRAGTIGVRCMTPVYPTDESGTQ